MFIGAFTRIYHLGFEPVDHLEIGYYFPIQGNHGSLSGVLRENLDQSPQHQPLFLIFLYFWSYFGKSILFLRLFPLIVGVATIYLTYILGRLLFGRTAGIIAAIFLAISPLHTEYCRSLNPYVMYTLLAVVLVIGFVKGLRRNNKLYFLLTALTGILLLFTHFYSIIFVTAVHAAVALYVILDKKNHQDSRKSLFYISMSLALVLMAAVADLPLAADIFDTMHNRYANQAAWMPVTTGTFVSSIVTTTEELVCRFSGIDARFNAGFIYYFILSVATFLLLMKHNSALTIPLLMIVAVPFTQQLLHESSTFHFQGFEIRYYLYFLPFYFTGLAGALFSAVSGDDSISLFKRAATVTLIASIAVPSTVSTATLVTTSEKPAYGFVSDFLKQNMKDGDAVVILPEPHYTGGLEAYLTPPGSRMEPPPSQPEGNESIQGGTTSGRDIGKGQNIRFSKTGWRWRTVYFRVPESDRSKKVRFFGLISITGPSFIEDLQKTIEEERIKRVWVLTVKERFHDERDLVPRDHITEDLMRILDSMSNRQGTLSGRFTGINISLFEIANREGSQVTE